jgi:small GTP-binding protein
LNLWDTSGQDNDTMRPLSYQDCNVFLLFFSLVDKNSFERIKSKWVAELKQTGHHETPYLVVGNKLDLRDDPSACAQLRVTPIKKEEGEKMAKEVGAIKYLECSAKTQVGLGEIFQAAITAVVEPEKLVPADELANIHKKKKGCKQQ